MTSPSPLSGSTQQNSSTDDASPSDGVLHSRDFSSDPSEEERRLAALYRYDVLDSPPEEAFDRITSLATNLFDAPFGFVSLIDEDRQWMKSCVGLDLYEIELGGSFCVHAIQTDGVTVISDARLDERVRDNPYVTGEPGIRFYAGAPLTTSDGYRIGTVCVLDTTARDAVDPDAVEHLSSLATLVVDELELRREVRMRKRREEELDQARRAAEQAREEAEQANEAMSRFFAGVAHDLQNPLTSLLMASNLLASHVSEDAQRYLDRIDNAAARMKTMTGSLMELSRLRSGALDLKTSAQDIRALVSDACTTASERLDRQRTATLDLPDAPAVACVDGDALLRILGNLVGNAFKHTDDADDVWVRVCCRNVQEETTVVVEVEDSGPGIPEEQLPTLFDPFTRGDDSTEGSGLGLTVAKDLTEAMGGSLTVESTRGEGTCFRLKLPGAPGE